MSYTWFKIFNTDDFDESGLVSKTYVLNLEDVGLKEILVTKGITYGITYDGIFLAYNLNGLNPFYFEGHAIFRNPDNDVFLGIEDE